MTNHSLPHQTIGLFDSGVGGLTVMQKLMEHLPYEKMIYLGDTARVPYGNKSRETILKYSLENAQWLIQHNIKILVVACNTVSAMGLSHLEALQEYSTIPIVGMIEPGVEKVVECSTNHRIAILGTRATIQSETYQNAIKARLPNAEIFTIECPLIVPLIEEGWLSHEATKLVVKEYLKPLKDKDVDTILLGCTHYPLIKDLIQNEVGDYVCLVDPAACCAIQVKNLLSHMQKLSFSNDLAHSEMSHQYFTSDNPKNFQKIAEKLFGCPINDVKQIH
ncbi:MAG: glutamate racemase [Parachlamydiaceae bacterium]|nr:glutamate racemase [Parachlamydiaceae bacterium]